jgi:putative ABC transport system permease protein
LTLFARLEYLVKDVRFGIRTLLKTPMLTAIAIGSLALGIGGSTTMFSVVHGVILDPFPYRDADRLMSVHVQRPTGG